MVLMRGNDEVNETKVASYLGCEELLMASEEDTEKYLGAHPGSLGPIGVKEDVTILADQHLQGMINMALGANDDGYHYINANFNRDFKVDQFGDFRTVQEGETAPDGLPIKFTNGIENGRDVPMIMGCYGIGVSRLLSAISEQNADENGLVWPQAVAPFDIHVIPVNAKKEDQMAMAEEITANLEEAGYEVLVDDRKERAGVKFADADLIGVPIRVTVGKKAGEGIVEIKIRKTGETLEVHKEELATNIAILLKQTAE